MSKRTSWRDVIAIHPSADVFPSMSDEELKELADDIEKNGLRVPIATYILPGTDTEVVVDGRSRLDAMERCLGKNLIDPSSRRLSIDVQRKTVKVAPADLAGIVIGFNIHRRHLSPSQRAELVAAALLAGETWDKTAITGEGSSVIKPKSGSGITDEGSSVIRPKSGKHVAGKRGSEKTIVGKVAEQAGVARDTARRGVEKAREKAHETVRRGPYRKRAPKPDHSARAVREKAVKKLTEIAEWLHEYKGDAFGIDSNLKDWQERLDAAMPTLMDFHLDVHSALKRRNEGRGGGA